VTITITITSVITECAYIAASGQKCAGIKRPSPAHRQNIGWFSSAKQKENQRPTHWSDRASRPQSAGSDRPLLLLLQYYGRGDIDVVVDVSKLIQFSSLHALERLRRNAATLSMTFCCAKRANVSASNNRSKSSQCIGSSPYRHL